MRSDCRNVAFILVAACLWTGCGSAEVVKTRENAYVAVNEGVKAYQARDYATAAERLAVAVNGGGVNPDVYADSAVKLAVCYGALKKFDDANALLDKLEQGAPNLDEVYAARSFIYKKQGKAAESRAALTKAKRFNPRVQEIKG